MSESYRVLSIISDRVREGLRLCRVIAGGFMIPGQWWDAYYKHRLLSGPTSNESPATYQANLDHLRQTAESQREADAQALAAAYQQSNFEEN